MHLSAHYTDTHHLEVSWSPDMSMTRANNGFKNLLDSKNPSNSDDDLALRIKCDKYSFTMSSSRAVVAGVTLYIEFE